MCWRASLAESQLGIVVGLTAEARLARGLGRVAAGGGTPAGAAEAATSLIAQGATTLLSFGLAGGLDPAWRPGDVVIPRAVLTGGQLFATSPHVAPTADLLLGHDRVLASAAEKRAFWQATGAVAVDLESGAVALMAARAGVGFCVLRVICDPAERDLPPAALIALDASGRIGLFRVLGSVAKRPKQIGDLLRLARDANAARRLKKAGVVS
jgi:adenosylhomocysteine nucleosidase